MVEFLWVLILIASLIGALTCAPAAAPPGEAKPIDDTWCDKLRRYMPCKRRWWLLVAVLVLVATVHVWNNVLRTLLNLLLFFEHHLFLMTLLLAFSLVGFILAWRRELTIRSLAGGVVVGGAVTLPLVLGWQCLFIALFLLALFGLLWVQNAGLPDKERREFRHRLLNFLRWMCALLVTFLAAGLFLSRVLYGPSEMDYEFGDYVIMAAVITGGTLGLIWALGARLPLLGWVSGLLLVFFVGGLVLADFVNDLPAKFADIADYFLFFVLLELAISAIIWVRGVPLQPLGWVSVVMILFLGSGLFFSSILYGKPEDFADIEDQFKYGSIGSDHFMARGIPYYIWEILPQMEGFAPEEIIVSVLPAKSRDAEKIKYAPRYGKPADHAKCRGKERDAAQCKGMSYEAFGLVREEHKKARLKGENKDIVIDRPIGFSKRKVFGMDFIGINCAFCHVSTIRKDGLSQPQIILGMPANTTDIELFFHFLFGAAEKEGFTLCTAHKVMNAILEEHPEMKFGMQVGEVGISGVCQEIKNSIHRFSYRLGLIPLTGMYARRLKKDFYFIDPHNPERVPRFGPGRVDAWSPGKTTLVKPPLRITYPGGIIDDTSIWNQKAREGMRLHWDGNTHVLGERNIIAGLVVNGPQIEVLDNDRLDRINRWIEGRPAPRFDDFRPEIERDEYGNGKSQDLLVDRIKQGRVIFQHWCASCHALGGERIGQVEPLDGGGIPQPAVPSTSVQLDTDPARLLNFTAELADALNTLGTDKWELRNFKAQKGYVNMLLDGIWLRAPYLHNGSVPTMRDLLNKPCEAEEKPYCRSRSFYRGQDLYDWKNLGFKSEVTIEPGDTVDITLHRQTDDTAFRGVLVDEKGMVPAIPGLDISLWGLTGTEAGEAILVEREAKVLMEKDRRIKKDKPLELKTARKTALKQITAEAVELVTTEHYLVENDARAWVRKINPLATVEIHKKIPERFFLFDTTLPGNSNRGHLYGTDLMDKDKDLLIEFMKSL